MVDTSAHLHGDEAETVHTSGQLVARQVQFANAFVTPFAAAVAAELEEFGLAQHKIEDILIRSARRFGAVHAEALNLRSAPEIDSSQNETDIFSWLKAAGGQAFDFLASVVATHGPGVWEKVSPVAEAVFVEAINSFLRNATGPRGAKTSTSVGKSRK
jgi:hypothetical protein